MRSIIVFLLIFLLLIVSAFAQENVAPPIDEKNLAPQKSVLDQKDTSTTKDNLQSPNYNLDIKEITPELEKGKAGIPQTLPKAEKPVPVGKEIAAPVEPVKVVEEKKINPPQIKEIYFGNRKYQEIGEPFIISNRTKIKFKVEGADGFAANSVSLAIDENAADSKALSSNDLTAAVLSGAKDNPTAAEYEYKGAEFKEGEHIITFKATNAGGSAQTTAKVSVLGGPPRVIGIPLAFPSPAKIQDQKVVLQYQLSSDAKIAVYILSTNGIVLKKFTFEPGQEGGSAGYDKIVWDLKTDQGTNAGGGIYLFNIVDLEQQKVMNRGKITLVY
ncbi:hypothetical protein HZC35_01330 [Candidatus Saganbacteria bacterium]|nr:hypothetical protein [Candidatus Saganbacteria bacterium]